MNIISRFSELSTKTYSVNLANENKNNTSSQVSGAPVNDKTSAIKASGSTLVTLSQASITVSRINDVSDAKENTASSPSATNAVNNSQALSVSKNTNNPYANSILSGIDAQLSRDITDGANSEALQSRLTAGLEGFLQGFDDAFEQLSAMSMFNETVRGDVLQTKEQVLTGLAQKADELGLDKTAIEQAQKRLAEQQAASTELAKTQTIQSHQQGTDAQTQDVGLPSLASFNAFAAKENTFSFHLTTADGDKIEILASALKAGGINHSQSSGQMHYAEKNAFAFSVDGELDEAELTAINDLLSQVNTVATSFFDGNLEQAFEQAVNMGFDASEIKDFALVLTQTSTTRIQDAYDNPQVAKSASNNQPLVDLGNFMIELDKANLLAEQVKQDLAIVGQLADQFNEARSKQEENSLQNRTSVSDFINRLSAFNAHSES